MHLEPAAWAEDLSDEPHQVCRTCGDLKPLSDYRPEPSCKRGVHTSCRPCQRAYNRRYMRDRFYDGRDPREGYGVRPGYVYFLYDEVGRLLYVGKTLHPHYRLQQHRVCQPWWDEVTHARIEVYETEEDSFAAEAEAIARRMPLYNKQRPSPPDMAPTPIDKKEISIHD